MTEIVFLVLFIVPGVLVEKMFKIIRPSTDIEESEHFKITNLILYSTLVMFMNMTIISFTTKIVLTDFGVLKTHLNSLYFFGGYILLSLFATSPIGAVIVNIFHKYGGLNINNLLRKSTGREKVIYYNTVWDAIFENKDRVYNDKIAIILKDGGLVNAGVLGMHSLPKINVKEIELWYTDIVCEYYRLEMDKSYEERRWFKEQSTDYNDLINGYTVKLYSCRGLITEINNRLEQAVV